MYYSVLNMPNYIVDLRPDLPVEAIRPTKGNPDIRVAIGNEGGKYVPKSLIYPEYYSPDEVKKKVQRYNAETKDKPCKVCQRYAAEQSKNKISFFAIGILVITILFITLRKKKKKE